MGKIKYILYECENCHHFFLRKLDDNKQDYLMESHLCKCGMYEMRKSTVREEDIRYDGKDQT